MVLDTICSITSINAVFKGVIRLRAAAAAAFKGYATVVLHNGGGVAQHLGTTAKQNWSQLQTTTTMHVDKQRKHSCITRTVEHYVMQRTTPSASCFT
jgi:hypothetical protein